MRKRVTTLVMAVGVAATSVLSVAAPVAGATPQVRAATSATAFNFYNIETQRCIDLPGFWKGRKDGPVSQYTCDYTARDNQRFFLVRNGSFRGFPVYLIKNKTDGLCLDLPGFGAVPARTRVTEYTCRPTNDNQSFYAQPAGRGTFLYRHVKAPRLCLDVEGHQARVNDVRLMLWPCNAASDDHLWAPITSASSIARLPKPEPAGLPAPGHSHPGSGITQVRAVIPGRSHNVGPCKRNSADYRYEGRVPLNPNEHSTPWKLTGSFVGTHDANGFIWTRMGAIAADVRSWCTNRPPPPHDAPGAKTAHRLYRDWNPVRFADQEMREEHYSYEGRTQIRKRPPGPWVPRP